MSKVNPKPGTLPAAPTCLQGHGEHPVSSRALPWQRLINLAGNDDMSCNLTGGLQSDRSVHIEKSFCQVNCTQVVVLHQGGACF